MPIPALIAGGANVAASGVQSLINTGSAKRNYKYGEKAAQNAYKRQMDAWNKQNEYNLPSNVRKRLEDAGLSTGLMYSGNAAASSNAGGLSSVPQNQSAGTHQPVRGEGYMANALNAMALQSQIELNKSAANKNNAEADATSGYKAENSQSSTELNHALAGNAKAQSSLNEFNLSIQQDLRDMTVQQAEANLQQSRSALEKLIEDTESSRLSNTFNRKTMDTRVDTVTQGLKNATADYVVKTVEVEAKKQGITLSQAQVGEITQKTLNLSKDNLIQDKTIREKNADIATKELNNYLQSVGINPNSSHWFTQALRISESLSNTTDSWFGRSKRP